MSSRVKLVLGLVLVAFLVLLFFFAESCHSGNEPQQLDEEEGVPETLQSLEHLPRLDVAYG